MNYLPLRLGAGGGEGAARGRAGAHPCPPARPGRAPGAACSAGRLPPCWLLSCRAPLPPAGEALEPGPPGGEPRGCVPDQRRGDGVDLLAASPTTALLGRPRGSFLSKPAALVRENGKIERV
ncbi:hypothetical protein MC885_012564 [Smutsia gigantea]|nr:hypothetical protein MC885_012564 [Smutsia gigantea]